MESHCIPLIPRCSSGYLHFRGCHSFRRLLPKTIGPWQLTSQINSFTFSLVVLAFILEHSYTLLPQVLRMSFLSRLCCCVRDPSGDEKQEMNKEKETVSTLPMAKSSQELASQALPILSNTTPDLSQQKNAETLVEVPAPAPAQLEPPLYTNHPSSLWENWKLDTEFLQQIREWNSNHPDRTLPCILNAIYNGIDKVEDSVFLELIPDGAILPIGKLVKGLMRFCKLVVKIALSNDDAVMFTREIVTWLDALVSTYDSGGGGKLESDAWRSLDEMGELINGACRWASKLLNDGTTISSINQRLSVENRIQDYRKEFTRISEQFTIISGIRLARGLDDVKQGLDSVEQGLDNVEQGLDNVAQGVIEMEQGLDNVEYGVVMVAQDTHMLADNENTTKRLKFLEERLLLRLVKNASYNHQNKRPCEPGTRIEILNEIRRWFEDVSEGSPCFYWLSGQPGIGKSAITASIAKACLDCKILGTQFFISRNDATTTDPRVLFPTICWELCQRFPRVAVVMEQTLQDQPTLIDDISDDQAAELFVKAIEAAAETDRSKAVAVVIDALDETDTKYLRSLAEIFSRVVTNLPRNAKVFISSRTEDAITHPFNPLRSFERVKSKHLTAKDSIMEVPQFMKKKVIEILKEYNIDWADWGDDRMKRFSSQASGLYIWAETALKYLRTAIRNSGVTCFNRVLDITEDHRDGVNNLYLKILRETCQPGDWEYQRFRRIVGAILVRRTALSIADIRQLLNLKDPSYSVAVDLVHFVRQYRTVLVDDTQEIDESAVPRMHKSFADFITSEWAQEFRVDISASHGELALQCISQLQDINSYLLGVSERPSFSPQLVYASQYWQSHLTRMIEPDMNDDDGEKKDIRKDDTQSLPADPRGVMDLKSETEEIKRRGLSLFGFSPDGTQIASPFPSDIHIRDARTGTETMSLVGHASERDVGSIAFSPNGTQIVSDSGDRTARIWDTQTGRELHVLCGHTSGIGGVGFSHDGRTVVTCSYDTTVRTWDSSTGQQLNVFIGHEKPVCVCTFSRNDRYIASQSWKDRVTIVWNVNSGNLISKIQHDEYRLMLFCPCGDHLMSCDANGGITLWDAGSGNKLGDANPTVAQLAFVDPEQESASNFIHVPPVLEQSGSNTPHLYSLQVKPDSYCTHAWGVVERDQPEGVWALGQGLRTKRGFKVLLLYVAAGATVMLSGLRDE